MKPKTIKTRFEKKFPQLFDGNDGRYGYDAEVTESVLAFIKAEVSKAEKANDKAWRKRIEEIPRRKFPIGERQWCVKCARRIKSDQLQEGDK